MNTSQGKKLAVYFCVGSENTNGRPLLDVVKQAVLGGVTTVQLREKDVSGKALSAHKFLEVARETSQMLSDLFPDAKEGPLLIINDRVDVAMALHLDGYRVDGVHLGQNDLPPDVVGMMFDAIGFNNAIIGLSCRSEDALEKAAQYFTSGALDYVGMGPLNDTLSKPDVPSGLGITRWGELAKYAHSLAPNLPILGIGGVTPEDALPLKQAGAAGYCCITYISHSQDVKSAAETFSHAWRK
ncbi:MAG: thiamine phosphate synthase [Candidatus Ancillula sp.]|jgi:thiamine-phosphate diphosphorylase|nr:thiamine phosphate synthase [Candidatus Ancillula sp.]